MIEMLNMCCLKYMKTLEDDAFELAIIDCPYGIKDITGKEFSHGRGTLKNRAFNQGNSEINAWDKAPPKEYFDELFRVSENQIIWGGNYFSLPKYRCVIVWDKCQPFPNFSSVEIAWSSFNKPASLFKFDNRYAGKIHPVQKPIKLYEWLLINYAKEGDRILDTHGGSFSSAIACHNLGFDMVICELDPDYYAAAVKRFQAETSQKHFNF